MQSKIDDGAVCEAPAPKPESKPKTTKAKAPPSLPPKAPKPAKGGGAAPKTTKKKPRARKPTKPAKGTVLLQDVADAFIAYLEGEGYTRGSIASYSAELSQAIGFLGAEVPVATITEERVREYFESPLVTVTRSGAPKSPRTIAKSRRVLRLALFRAEEVGLIGKAPVPHIS